MSRRAKLWLCAVVYVATSIVWGPAAEAAFHLEHIGNSRPANGLHISGLLTAPRQPVGGSLASILPQSRVRARSEAVAAPAASGSGASKWDCIAKGCSGSVRDRVAAAWPGDDAWALKTVACESGFDPNQIGGGGNNFYGLWQFGSWARAHYGNPLNMSVEQQTAAAWKLLNDAGSSQWTCSPWRYRP